MTFKRKEPPLRRTTEALTGTHSHTEARLCFPSAFALEYAQLWLRRAGSIKVPRAGLVRRALRVYADHLRARALEGVAGLTHEVRAVHSACSASQVAEEEQQLAQLRLHTAPADKALPDLHELLAGPQRLAELQELDERVESICQGIFASPGFKLKAAQRAKREALAAATTTAQEPSK